MRKMFSYPRCTSNIEDFFIVHTPHQIKIKIKTSSTEQLAISSRVKHEHRKTKVFSRGDGTGRWH